MVFCYGRPGKLTQHSGKQFINFLGKKKKKGTYHTIYKLHSWASIPEKRKPMFTQKPVQKCIHSSLMSKSQKLLTTQIYFNGQMVKSIPLNTVQQ